MKIGLLDVTTFVDSIRTLNDLVMETSIKVSNEGIQIAAMDAANVCLCVLKLTAKEFSELIVNDEESFDVKLSDLKQILGRIEKGSNVTLESTGDKLKVTSVGKNGKKKEFEMKLIELDHKAQASPNLDKFKAEILVDNTELRDAIADVSIVSESFEAKVEGKKFTISASGDLSKSRTEVIAMVICADDAKARSKYSIEYFNKFTSAKLGKSAKIQLGTDYPISLTYSNEKGSTMQFILAPRIEND